MTSTTTLYRNTHPEYRERERTKYREIEYNIYSTDEDIGKRRSNRRSPTTTKEMN